jgi:hypothetical protein
VRKLEGSRTLGCMMMVRRAGLSEGDGPAEDPPEAVTRGYVLVPTEDVRRFLTQEAIVFGVGFMVGTTLGVVLGNAIFGARARLERATRGEI